MILTRECSFGALGSTILTPGHWTAVTRWLTAASCGGDPELSTFRPAQVPGSTLHWTLQVCCVWHSDQYSANYCPGSSSLLSVNMITLNTTINYQHSQPGELVATGWWHSSGVCTRLLFVTRDSISTSITITCITLNLSRHRTNTPA